jgi:type II secretory pathway pseudopilin PulG
MHSGDGRRGQCGFSYLLLMVVVAVLAITAHAVATASTMQRRAAEQALLDAGEDIRAALLRYQAAGGNGPTSSPKELTDLLRDPRVPGVRRFLRRVPIDPMTGHARWGVLRDELGGIAAVHSMAEGVPIKQEGFAVGQEGFVGATSYAQWTFGPHRMKLALVKRSP